MTPKERMEQLAKEYKERANIQKFVRYCQMEGLGSVAAEEDRFFSPEQEAFFDRYEYQIDPVRYAVRLLQGIVETE